MKHQEGDRKSKENIMSLYKDEKSKGGLTKMKKTLSTSTKTKWRPNKKKQIKKHL
jgi:hypothetical protein